MFKVIDIETNKVYTVYDVKTIGKGLQFLVYKEQKWQYDSANNYREVSYT